MRVVMSAWQGRPGERVSVRVMPTEPSRVAAVRLRVGDELDLNLQRAGDEWVGEQDVPWDAPVGTYHLSFEAYDAMRQAVERAEETFAVQD